MLRVATLNIWNRLGPWERRLVAIRAQLARLAPDVIGLQEVLRDESSGAGDDPDRTDQAKDIAAELGYHVAYGAAFHTGSIGFGNAILSRFPIVRSESISLPKGGDQKRSLLFAELDAPFGRLPFFTTHLNWRLHEGAIRRQQVRAVAYHVARFAPIDGFPPIIVGDFNAEPDSDEIRFMRGLCAIDGETVYFADAFAIAGDGSPGVTFARRNPFAALVHEPNRRIDYVFVRGPDANFRGDVASARVCFDEPEDGVFASDHFGVVADVTTESPA